MIAREAFETLKEEFGLGSSWAVWATLPDEEMKGKTAVEDLTPFEDEDALLGVLNGDYIFVGLNPAVHDNDWASERTPGNPVYWTNFHSGDKRRAQDYKLRYAFFDTPYWGSFMTDIYTAIADTDAASALKRTTPEMTEQSVRTILRIREILGGSATIVAMGNRAHRILADYCGKHPELDIPLKRIRHASAFGGAARYREKVLSQLGGSV